MIQTIANVGIVPALSAIFIAYIKMRSDVRTAINGSAESTAGIRASLQRIETKVDEHLRDHTVVSLRRRGNDVY